MDKFVGIEKDDKMFLSFLKTILQKAIKVKVIQYRIQKQPVYITIKDEPSVNEFTITYLLLSIGN